MNINIGKIKAWKIEHETLTMIGSLDSQTNSVVNCLTSANSEIVFGGCADGSILAWNIFHDKSDCMQPENRTVRYLSMLFLIDLYRT